MDPLHVHFDGLCQPINPQGIACYGFVARRGDEVLHEEHGLAAEPFTEGATNNVAEYVGLLKALAWLDQERHHARPVRVHGDSMMVVDQMNGKYKPKSEPLLDLYEEARRVAARFSELTVTWVPRAENAHADDLTERAYRDAMDRSAEYRRRAEVFLATPAELAALTRRGLPVKPYMSRMDFMKAIQRTKG